MLLNLLEQGTAKPHLKHLNELFSFLLDFAKLGDQEAEFLLNIQVSTYLPIRSQEHSLISTTIDIRPSPRVWSSI